jgi:hypothetical protein
MKSAYVNICVRMQDFRQSYSLSEKPVAYLGLIMVST